MSWLKFDTSTPEKPEVLAITIELGWDDPDLTVGKLLKVWRWFDSHSLDGNAPSVTLSLLDRIIGVTGITQAMLNVGWLRLIEGGGLAINNFENHNGKTAKDRALAAKRASSHRGKSNSNDESVTSSVTNELPREEKIREDKKRKVISKDIALSRPDIVSIETWNDFLKVRKAKNAPITQTALNGIINQSSKIGITLEQALIECINRNWTTLKAEWLTKPNQTAPTNKQEALEARNRTSVEAALRM